MSAHDYCPGHAADGSDGPTGTAADLRAIECPRCTPGAGYTEGGVRLLAALGADTTVNPSPPEGMWIAACAPTDDPDYWQMIESCGDDCHHPVHAFGHPERIRHLIPTEDAVLFRHEPLRGNPLRPPTQTTGPNHRTAPESPGVTRTCPSPPIAWRP